MGLDNLKELINAISEFDNIRSFIEHIQLVMDNELNNKNNSVNILTFHASKGLEFENIFLPGVSTEGEGWGVASLHGLAWRKIGKSTAFDLGFIIQGGGFPIPIPWFDYTWHFK